MDFQVRLSEDALNDFEEIVAYSSAHFPESTQRFTTAILDHIYSLEKFPYVGKPLARGRGKRILLHTPLRITYEIWEDDHVVEILEIRHASRS